MSGTRVREHIYLELAEIALKQAEALLHRAPFYVLLRHIVRARGHTTQDGGSPLGEQRLEAQLELGLLLEIERVDLSGCSHAVICAYTRVRTSEDGTCAGACHTRLDGRDAPSRAHARV